MIVEIFPPKIGLSAEVGPLSNYFYTFHYILSLLPSNGQSFFLLGSILPRR